jgi:flagellar protein FliL
MESPTPADVAAVEAPPEAPKRKTIALVATIVAGLAAGGAAGLFVLGPTLAHKAQAQAATPAKSEKKPGEISKEADVAKVLHAVDNLVLNPANSGGTRFLMVNATFELKDASALERMKLHDPEIRDVLLNVLGTKTVEELADVTKRDPLKKELIAAIQRLFPDAGVTHVYFPQFVIQ